MLMMEDAGSMHLLRGVSGLQRRLRGQKVRRTLSVGLPADVTVKRKKCDGDPGGLVQGQVPEITVTLNHTNVTQLIVVQYFV